MQYPDGQIARRGDKVRLWGGTVGTVVCSLDTDEFSDEYPRDQWDYLRRGVLIHSAQTGLIHYLEPEATFQLKCLKYSLRVSRVADRPTVR
jgi:hypothetical protein